MQIGNVVLVGTSHISTQSVKAIEKAIDEHKPAIIALELDRQRLEGLLHPRKEKVRLRDIRHIGISGYLFMLLGAWAEKMLGDQVGTKPGDDMMAAIRVARARKIPLALVDQEIQLTLKRLSRAITWRERFRFVWDVIKGIFGGKKKLPFDLRKVPDAHTIDKLLRDVKKRYPNFHRVLVTERNEVMARRLSVLAEKTDGIILAVVGAGHGKEMAALLRKKMKPTWTVSSQGWTTSVL